MIGHLGDFAVGKTIEKKFNTFTATGAPVTLGGTPTAVVYKRGSLVESTAGVTLIVDYDGLVGLHSISINTAADGTFYSTDSEFQIVLSAGTVNGVNVAGTIVGSFSLESRSDYQMLRRGIVLGVVGSGSTTTSIVTSSLSPAVTVNDQLKGRVIAFDRDTATAALRGQVAAISTSTSGGVLTVSALTTAPSSGDTFMIV